MHTNTLPALTAILVFLVTIAALGAEQSWWYIAPVLGFGVLVPLVYYLMNTDDAVEGTPTTR